MTSYSDALRIVLENASGTTPVETVPLVLSLGRYLAEPIVADTDLPAAPNSAMDGYAIQAGETSGASAEAPARLRVIGEAAAGRPFEGSVGAGEAVRIMTGGIIPDGADAVVEVEATRESSAIVEVLRNVMHGGAIRASGEDVHKGAQVITAGKRVTSGDIGILAALGVTNVPVRVKPKVGILATGNELVEPHRRPGIGQIRNSSSAALYAACVEVGAEPIDLGIARDDREELEEGLELGFTYDVLLTTGGVSAGAYDLVQHALPDHGVQVLFHKVNIRPGKPILFGIREEDVTRTLVFGLPGNPVSSLVTFHVFAVPALRAMLGASSEPSRLTARLTTPIEKGDRKRHFVRGFLSHDSDGLLVVSTTGTQSSGAMSSMSKANCLIVLDEETDRVDAGNAVTVELLHR